MKNHIHLLIKEGKEPLGEVFRRIGSRFVAWYNWKYERNGHLFQGRYNSEPVESDEYFWAVLVYRLVFIYDSGHPFESVVSCNFPSDGSGIINVGEEIIKTITTVGTRMFG